MVTNRDSAHELGGSRRGAHGGCDADTARGWAGANDEPAAYGISDAVSDNISDIFSDSTCDSLSNSIVHAGADRDYAVARTNSHILPLSHTNAAGAPGFSVIHADRARGPANL